MYDKYISLNEKFKSSVNLQFDLGNEEKIVEYVPTTDLCDVLKTYVKSVINGESIKSTLLSGPYGKGKSYLMLMITYLFSKHENRTLFKTIVEKISKIDRELGALILDVDNKGFALLPIIINNNSSDDLNQNFMLALNNALNYANIDDLVPNSTFNECLNEISKWENNFNNELSICLKNLNINIIKLKKGLKEYSKDSYEEFNNLFECMNHGYKFKSLVGSDIALIYDSVARKVVNYGYNGLFVIFDEFGVFLESKSNDFSAKLNKIQTFAEKCNASSKDNQIHFCCITHKDIKLYQSDKNLTQEFEKISGRFKQIRFDRSLNENYQIICNAILKNEDYTDIAANELKENNELIKNIKISGIFKKEELEFILNNGFPFNPISLYSLVNISEKIAQNERTLFTFISDSDLYSFKYFITNNENGLLNVDYIYNYFANTIKNNEEFRSLYNKVDSLSKIDLKAEHHNIFKCIAVMKIINDEIKFCINPFNISIALGMNYEITCNEINELISNNILRKNLNNNEIDFNIIADNDLNKLIEDIILTKVSKFNNCQILNEFNKDKYLVSNRYNFEYKMTRYFSTIYLDSSTFVNLNSLKINLDEEQSDGLIVNLLNDNNITLDEIKVKYNNLKDKDSNKIIIRWNDNKIDPLLIEKIRKYKACNLLISSKNKLSESLVESLKNYCEDLNYEISEYLKEYSLSSIYISKVMSNSDRLSNLMYEVLKVSYPKTLIFNNEQVNKNIISSVTTKARNNVIDNILKVSNKEYGVTSAEGTIKESFNETLNNSLSLIEELQNIIINNNKKINANELIDYMHKSDYGIRYGVIPMFIAEVISRMTVNDGNKINTVLMYNDSIQINVDSTNLTKMMINPNRYYFSFKKINKEKIELVKKLLRLFKLPIVHNFNLDSDNLIKGIRSYVSNLSPIIVRSSVKDNILSLNENEFEFKNLFLRHDVSTFDILIEELNFFGSSTNDIVEKISNIINSYNAKIKKLYEDTNSKIKEMFANLQNESLKTNYLFYKNEVNNLDNIILDDEYKKIYNVLEKGQNNDFELLDSLSLATVNCTLKDWNNQKKDKFYDLMQKFVNLKNSLQNLSSLNKEELEIEREEINLSPLANTLYTNIQDVLEEYGSSISNAEKTQILKKLIKEIIE